MRFISFNFTIPFIQFQLPSQDSKKFIYFKQFFLFFNSTNKQKKLLNNEQEKAKEGKNDMKNNLRITHRKSQKKKNKFDSHYWDVMLVVVLFRGSQRKLGMKLLHGAIFLNYISSSNRPKETIINSHPQKIVYRFIFIYNSSIERRQLCCGYTWRNNFVNDYQQRST